MQNAARQEEWEGFDVHQSRGTSRPGRDVHGALWNVENPRPFWPKRKSLIKCSAVPESKFSSERAYANGRSRHVNRHGITVDTRSPPTNPLSPPFAQLATSNHDAIAPSPYYTGDKENTFTPPKSKSHQSTCSPTIGLSRILPSSSSAALSLCLSTSVSAPVFPGWPIGAAQFRCDFAIIPRHIGRTP
ncbi:hypothetical protein OIDMADRAFT_23029 [Oidiodendron maius Zn]|uniref:Uncharacterized protein n=1 Tax=Oidiodendron maius (strain Zn) TaxID=913774 RepID=A0A0C3E1N0_OIDMZ|nr:hypothetical protein OIDMADRAFT_23029 [Oidiodendron maius Zn]